MEEEYLQRLNDDKEELEIPDKDILKIIELAKKRKEKSKIYISDGTLYEIIVGALTNYDYQDIDGYSDQNSKKEGLLMLLNEAREEFSDEEIYGIFNDLEEIKEEERYKSEYSLPTKRKSLEEIVERSARSLGL